MEEQKLFGKRVKELRKQKNLTQEQLSELLGVFQKQIGNIETGTTFTTMGNLKKLAEVLGVEIQDFFDFNQHKSRQELIEDIYLLVADASDEKLKLVYRVVKDLLI